ARLRGMLFGRQDSSTALLVSAKWLKTANASLLDAQQAKTIAEHKAALEQLAQRLDAELALERPAAMTAFLKQQRDDAQDELKQADRFTPQFLWLTFIAKELDHIEPTTPERRQLLAWAWNEELDRPETRDADDLQRELKARAVAPVSWPLSLIERLPAREQTDEEWAARLAIVEYAVDKPLDFQGTGDLLVRAGRDAPVDLAPLLVGLLRKQLQSQLGDLLGEPRPPQAASPKNKKAALGESGQQVGPALAESLKTAIQVAESEKGRGFRVTRMQQSDDLSAVTVTTQFVARLPNGSWEIVFQHSDRADAKQARPELEQRIQQDPQVKGVLDLTRQLGGAADAQIQQAIRFGAATMSAQTTCDRQFASFRDIYLKSVARPPLSINAR
ncbi:MAG TPA: hypothetical protein VK137_13115, partial [Planctomycetaceae bacterium]|nr:hypothetical protein [Planctomycetaceae bacterium]